MTFSLTRSVALILKLCLKRIKKYALDKDINSITPANQVIVFHVAILAQVNGYHLAPEQQPLHQHPAKGRHEEQMEQSCHHCAGHLRAQGHRANEVKM